jgi:hypothetical protein
MELDFPERVYRSLIPISDEFKYKEGDTDVQPVDKYDLPLNPQLDLPEIEGSAIINKYQAKFSGLDNYCKVTKYELIIGSLNLLELKFLSIDSKEDFILRLILSDQNSEIGVEYHNGTDLRYDKTPIPFKEIEDMSKEAYSCYKFVESIIIKEMDK